MTLRRIPIQLALLFAVWLCAWPGEAAAPFGRYTLTAETVRDNRTGLTWQRTLPAGLYTQPQAVAYCSGLSLSGTGWRLPTVNELISLVDDTRSLPTIDISAFPNTPGDPALPSSGFWTTTPSVAISGYYWIVAFARGGHYFFDPSTARGVRCVR